MKINLDTLRAVCAANIHDFAKYGDVVTTKHGMYIFQDNRADVLAVAHLDTVLPFKQFSLRQDKHNKFVFTQTLDDRLGVYLLLHYLKATCKYDILLTENEERCMSTARQFTSPRQYNWAFEFDRAGTDVVMYQYENDTMTDAVEDAGFKVGIGSYSDIADLAINAGAFNFGTGYYANHLPHAYANLAETKANADKFSQVFYPKYKKQHFEYTEIDFTIPHFSARAAGALRWQLCDVCGQMATTDSFGMYLCDNCLRYTDSDGEKPYDLIECEWCSDWVSPNELTAMDFMGVHYVCNHCKTLLLREGAEVVA